MARDYQNPIIGKNCLVMKNYVNPIKPNPLHTESVIMAVGTEHNVIRQCTLLTLHQNSVNNRLFQINYVSDNAQMCSSDEV